jgi:chemotaxis response regulator CheB
MGESQRVALLARPGEACERLRAALREAGGEIVLEADPATLTPDALRDARVHTVLVALDPAVEDALEKFDDVLGDPALAVIFDEADLAARREGWDAARWVRHLSAKLHRHDDVLPPGREPETMDDVVLEDVTFEPVSAEEAALDADEVALESIAFEDAKLDDIAFDVAPTATSDAIALDNGMLDTSAFDADLGGEIVLEGVDLGELGLDATALDLPSFDPVSAEANDDVAAPAASETYAGITFTDDVNALSFESDAAAFELPAPTFQAAHHQDAQDFDALMRDLGAGPANDAEPEPDFVAPPRAAPQAPVDLPNMDFDIAPAEAPPARESAVAKLDFSSLSLAEVTDEPMVVTPRIAADATPVVAQTPAHLHELERRISSLELVEDVQPGAPRGAVLVLAGIGGPDAVRQILTALPAGFSRAVLISQRLDGGRYDRLVQQLGRAAQMPVFLAEPAQRIEAGKIYVLPPEIGVDANNGLRFATGAPLLSALPADDSAVLMLSGADPALVDPALAHAANGALVAGQSPDGCYDAAAPIALTARGGDAGAPHELVQRLLQRWPA